nr:hypothetical protein [Tanacetum cinerariifolium]
DQMHSGRHEGGTYKQSGSTVVESGDRGYFSRKEIEEKTPSRSDGIDLKKETYMCKSDWEMLVHGLFSLFRMADQRLALYQQLMTANSSTLLLLHNAIASVFDRHVPRVHALYLL